LFLGIHYLADQKFVDNRVLSQSLTFSTDGTVGYFKVQVNQQWRLVPISAILAMMALVPHRVNYSHLTVQQMVEPAISAIWPQMPTIQLTMESVMYISNPVSFHYIVDNNGWGGGAWMV
jgi:hypothetical protein